MTKPRNPRLVLLAAILLPGVGHVLIGQAQRGLAIAVFTVLLGLLTVLAADPDRSFVGRHAGGAFVWALSILDAYRRARIAEGLAARSAPANGR